MYGQAEIATRLKSTQHSRPLAGFTHKVGQRGLVLGLLAAFGILDQGFKWWGWRHVTGVRVNYGGDVLVPCSIGSLYAAPVAGALLDLLDSALLMAAILFLVHRRRSTLVLISGCSIIGGWGTNLLDRLLMHYWTAPGSVRGVVDFIPIGQHYYNLADLFIVSGTPLFLFAITFPVLRRLVRKQPATIVDVSPMIHRPRRARAAVLAAAAQIALAAAVGVGAASFGGVTAPITSASIRYQPIFITHNGVAFDLT